MKLDFLKASTFGSLFLIGMYACNSSSNQKNIIVKNLNDKSSKPNVVLIYCDDLGYSDVSCYGSRYLKTPNIDKLAKTGVKFTNGHCASATSTPSRYGLLTGQYPWRNKKAHILPGDAPMLIDTTFVTLPKLFHQAGYITGVVGKWHLGLGNGHVDWNKRIYPNPNSIGFQQSYIMAATVDRVPTVYLKDGLVQGLDSKDPLEVNYKHNYDDQATGRSNPELLEVKNTHGHDMTIVNGIGRIGYMKGGEKACWKDDEMATDIYKQADRFITENKNHPFFLYYALHEPHVPRVPSKQFEGKSGMGPRGDVILEIDWLVGKVMDKLKSEGLEDNTIVIFSSDNGPVLDDGYYDMASYRWHRKNPTGDFRGGKYSLFEGGTAIPLIINWKNHIQPQVSDALVCQMDFLASFGEMFGIQEDFKDSKNMLPVLLGRSHKGRNSLIVEATGRIAYIEGNWRLIPPYKGGKRVNRFVYTETGNDEDYQLYDISIDAGEKHNLAKENPEKLKELIAHFESEKNNNI